MIGDFHIHTNYSDGEFSIEEVITMAKNKNLNIIAITDHDVLDGAIKANQLFNSNDFKVIVGVELSTKRNEESIHILGYFPNLNHLDIIERHLKVQRENRLNRAHKIKELLKEHFQIDLNMDAFVDIDSITRGSIAEQIIKQGYPYTKIEIFNKMIGQDCPAYIPSTHLTTARGIKLIHDAGGLAVLAHPVLYKKNNIDDLINLGVDGIEAIYPKNNNEDTIRFTKLSRDYNLFITAGSDFHLINDVKHGNIGDVYLEGVQLDTFLKKLWK